MNKFNEIYKQIIFEQKYLLWKQKNSLISQGIVDWIGDNIIKPVGSTLGGVGDTFTSLGKGDLKGVGQGLVKTIASPVKLAVNVAKAPIDVVEAGVKLCEGDKAPDKVKEAAEKIPDDDVKKVLQQKPELKKIIVQKKLDIAKTKILIASVGTVNVIVRSVKRAAQAAGDKKVGKGADKKEAPKLNEKQQEMLDILKEAMGDDAKAQVAWDKRFKRKRIAIFDGKKKKIKAIPFAKFDANADAYIKLANKLNPNADEEAETEDESDQKQIIDSYREKAVPVIARLLKKDEDTIETRFDRRVKKGLIYVVDEKGQVNKKGIPIANFMKDHETYTDNLDKHTKQAADKAAADKADADAKNRAEKFLKLIAVQSDGKYNTPSDVIQNWKTIKPTLEKQPAWSSPKGKENLAKLDAYIAKKTS